MPNATMHFASMATITFRIPNHGWVVVVVVAVVAATAVAVDMLRILWP
jgi:hypothetical protein